MDEVILKEGEKEIRLSEIYDHVFTGTFNGKDAIVRAREACDWLEKEMKKLLPEGCYLVFKRVPILEQQELPHGIGRTHFKIEVGEIKWVNKK